MISKVANLFYYLTWTTRSDRVKEDFCRQPDNVIMKYPHHFPLQWIRPGQVFSYFGNHLVRGTFNLWWQETWSWSSDLQVVKYPPLGRGCWEKREADTVVTWPHYPYRELLLEDFSSVVQVKDTERTGCNFAIRSLCSLRYLLCRFLSSIDLKLGALW